MERTLRTIRIGGRDTTDTGTDTVGVIGRRRTVYTKYIQFRFDDIHQYSHELATAQSLVPETMNAVRPEKNVPSLLAWARWVHHWLASRSDIVPVETAWATWPPRSSWRKLYEKVTVRKTMETSVIPTSRKRRGS